MERDVTLLPGGATSVIRSILRRAFCQADATPMIPHLLTHLLLRPIPQRQSKGSTVILVT